MTKINSVIGYWDYYTSTIHQALTSIDKQALQETFDTLFHAYHQGNKIFVCGNGGSAAIAEHFVCDHMKGVKSDTDLLPKLISLSSNIPLITALANDCGYENIFSKQLEYSASAGDVLIAISSSGNSPNITSAIKKARSLDMRTISLVGFNGGTAKHISEICLHVNVDNYGICEDVHQNIMHIIAQFMRQKYTTKEEVVL